MTVHMIRIRCEMPDGLTVEEVRQAVENWVSQQDEALTDFRKTITLVSLEGVPEHLYGEFRFGLTEGKTALLDDIENALVSYVGWYLIGHHWCEYDEPGENVSGNGWSGDPRTYGTVPDGVTL